MERHCDHWFNGAEINNNHTVVISNLSRIQFLVIFRSVMKGIERFDLVIGTPNGGQTGCLCCHNVDTDTEISTQVGDTRAYEFHHLVVHITVGKYFTDNSQCHVLRTHTLHRFTCQINTYNARHIDIIGSAQKLFCQLAAAFADGHCTKGTVTCMAVRSQDHAAACCQHFTGKLMDNSLMRRYINAAVFLGTGKAKHMIIFIDRTANGTKAVVAVCQYIRDRELLKSACSCCLNDTDKSDVMGCHLVKLYLQLLF